LYRESLFSRTPHGYSAGKKHYQAAALDVEVGRGHVILLGFRPQWRGQSFGTFRMIFNALLFARPPA